MNPWPPAPGKTRGCSRPRPGTSSYAMYKDEQADPPALVCRFGMYPPPLLEALGLAELTHDARNNKMRAI